MIGDWGGRKGGGVDLGRTGLLWKLKGSDEKNERGQETINADAQQQQCQWQ